MSRLCERADLEAVVPIWSRWTVDESGNGKFMVQQFAPDGMDVEQYHCTNCDLYFDFGDGQGGESLEAAWERALDHLKHQQAGGADERKP